MSFGINLIFDTANAWFNITWIPYIDTYTRMYDLSFELLKFQLNFHFCLDTFDYS